jgi:lysophospholipase L1-like esterase
LKFVRFICAALMLAFPAAAAVKKPTKTVRPKAPAVSAKARAQAQDYANRRMDDTERSPIENAAGLVPFFERLYRLEHESDAQVVRILHWGDSHTAADEWTARMRSLFQNKFGDGGSGFSLAGHPFRGYRRIGEKGSMSRGWATLGLLNRDGDGNYGLGGVAIETSRAGETVALEADAEQGELWFYRRPGAGSFAVSTGGVAVLGEEAGARDTVSADGAAGLGVLTFRPGDRRWEVITQDSRPVRLFGWVADNLRGVTYESLGINGAQASLPSYWNQEMLAAQISRRDPALVVVAYGTNEASNRDWDLSNYRDVFAELLGRIRAAAPAASILVIGPPDRMHRVRGKGWQTFPRMDQIVDAQRIAAGEYRATFWDWRARMGGAGAMHRWVTAGYAAPDHAHLTAAGYQLLGDVIYRDILSEYARFVKIRERVADQSSNGQASHHPKNHPGRVEKEHEPQP